MLSGRWRSENRVYEIRLPAEAIPALPRAWQHANLSSCEHAYTLLSRSARAS
jgi:hypothetical protein